MTPQFWHNLARGVAIALMILTAMLATAANSADLGFSRQALALVAVVQAGIAVALGFLPRAQGDGVPRP